MQRVIAVNLNGNAYQLEETAYAALRAYLDRAELQLKDNPDKAEIMADLEQAIGDKSRRFLGPHKTVMATAEIEQILAEMGPVEGAAEPAAGGAARDAAASASGSHAKADAGDAPKRLYRIVDGAMISGVCAGLAAFTHTNVTVIRLIFVIVFFATGGAFGLVYVGLMFILPPATTSEEHAAAHGMPFNAQELVDQAKQYSEQFKKGAQQFKEGAFQNNWEDVETQGLGVAWRRVVERSRRRASGAGAVPARLRRAHCRRDHAADPRDPQRGAVLRVACGAVFNSDDGHGIRRDAA
jgi:phage shock protein PspC (stress-responsive transcriptional regulator)